MSRLSFSHVLNLVLLAGVVGLGWLLLQRPPHPDTTAPTGASHTDSAASASGRDLDAVSAQLSEINARISAIERQALPQTPTATTGAAPAQVTTRTAVTPQAAALAQQRLRAMFPSGRVDREGMQRFHIAMANLPPDEQIALTAAMSQAVNAARITLQN